MNQTNLPVKKDDDENDGGNPVPATASPASTTTDILQARKAALQPLHYSARVTRKNPAAIVVLIDQSGSMSGTIKSGYGSGREMAGVVAEIVNDLFDNLTMKCQRDNSIRDYFNLMVIGYGRKEETADIAWEGKLSGKEWVLVSELKQHAVTGPPVKTLVTLPWVTREDTKAKRCWISPHAGTATPMLAAFRLCKEKLTRWVQEHRESFPPMVFNITDGQPTDCTAEQLVDISSQLKGLSTADGNVLLFNCLLTHTEVAEVILPAETARQTLSSPLHLALFDASSYLPDEMRKITAQLFKDNKYLHEKIKGVILNSMFSSLAQLLNVGTNTVLSNAND